MLAMILAGGRGTRLLDLTSKVAKPAVYYGGKYRIIDFPLSNCANSNIGVVGVLTQYESVLLNAYTAQGSRWGIDGRDNGVFVLPPREKNEGFGKYRGTADAIYQNIDFMDMYDPEYVLILSGDHIYKMNYDKMLDFHKQQKADVTIAGLEVTWEEAKRFGIMNTNEKDEIVEFEEKPAHPKNNLASMGIYIFSYKALRKALIADAPDDKSDHDFGKNIIPTFLNEGKKIVAYRFKGYWKDVGTIDSLWQANMDLLDENDLLNMEDDSWKIYTEDVPTTPQFIGKKARIKRAYINQGCVVNGTIENSVLFRDCRIHKNAKVIDSVLMPEVVVEEGAVVRNCIVAEGLVIPAGASIGNKDKIELISKKAQVK
ncbi:MAG: glucose-1-phosphate adenylyltransferase [Erysipelotrichaceae bacterium]|nr:glucose-1-phosphate adenylyltransferase [Erysipelotrichaceae bacterium]MBQ1299978.1 glucose-1-phosphate adenylyltransferase [Erysipelotrichaceae bacterium]MBQ1303753.1 glucose-1-phosphate adenylyltransferase [Erysipelotrichaceae bacterium]MBQ2212999.1 glucose-1-phosphate adenylyltransferase [Erysipelotrichaceae bacterium]MBR2599501.1 glucose-1-phosphate adenylyltransferase [Erysipelotrichaceae bacterium]